MNNSPIEKNRRVLIIDDNRAIHDDFRKILSPGTAEAAALDATEAALFGKPVNVIRKIQYEIDSAYQGQEGVLLVQRALAEGRPYALAFVDIRMPPGWDGVETTQKIWAIDPAVQIVLCTAYADYSWDEMFEKIGNSDGLVILKKPFDTVEALQLAHALTEKWWLQQQSRKKMEELESRVAARTAELAKTNAVLQRQQTELRVLFDFIPAMICFKDTDNTILRINQRTADFFGKSVADIEGKSFHEIYPQEAARVYADDLEVIRAGAPQLGMVEAATGHAGESLWLQKDKIPVCDADGKVTGIVVMVQDITQRKRAEEELQWQAAFLEAQVNSSMDGIIVVNEHGRKIQQNQRTADLFKIPPPIVADPDDRKQVQWVTGMTKNPGQFAEKVRHLYAHPNEVSRDEIELKDGTVLDRYAAPVVGKNGKYYGRIWTFRDITERKRAETVLLESKRFLRSTLDALSAHIAILDEHGTIIEVNAAWNRFASDNHFNGGMSGVGDNYLAICTSATGDFTEEALAVADGLRALIAGQREEFQLEYPCHSPQAKLWFIMRATRFGSDGPVRVVVAHENITDRKLAEGLVRESEERYRSLIDNAHDAIFTIGADGAFTSLNPAVETMGGLLRSEWIGKPFAAMVHPDDLPLAMEMFQRILQGGQSPVHELRSHPSLKRAARIEMTLAAQTDAGGKIIGVLGIGRDITERKKLEERLYQSQKLETVGKLAGGIAHEFNSILTAIIGQSELLLADLPAGSVLAQGAAEISKAANRAAMLTRQLLAYGRKQFLQPEVLELNRVVAGMEAVLNHLLGGDVSTQIISAPGRHAVKADAGQIEQVIINLVINARDAMPNGGKLTLEIANAAFDADSVGRYPELKPGGYVMLAISDTGTGMSAEVKARAFEPFFTTKGVGQGAGLGLSTCYGIIKQSGGHISVYSELGRGTTFKVYLPQVEPPPTVSVPRLDAPDLPRGSESILLVEDDPALREMAATLLRRLGYTVFAAANGVEALSLKHERSTGHIDLLFTDVVMPHMSGKELADRVQALYPRTKILFTSAYTENAIVHQGVLNKGVLLLQKPFTPSALAQKLRAVLDQPEVPKPAGAPSAPGLNKTADGENTP